jgi:hypothetical protein
MTYVFELKCPRCGKSSEGNFYRREPPPAFKCGDCLMHDVEIVEMKIVGVREVQEHTDER